MPAFKVHSSQSILHGAFYPAPLPKSHRLVEADYYHKLIIYTRMAATLLSYGSFRSFNTYKPCSLVLSARWRSQTFTRRLHRQAITMASLNEQYQWTTSPVVVGAPMRIIALPRFAVEISAAGGFGFIGAGNNLDELDGWLEQSAELISKHARLQAYREKTGMLPVGFAYFNWAPAADLEKAIAAVKKWKPAAVWQFGAHKNEDYATWAEKIRQAGEGRTKVWVQVGSVADAVEVAENAKPDVLVVQGTDAGGHGLESGASLITLLPEVADAIQAAGATGIKLVAAGGVIEGRGAAAALALGADGVCLGTRFLASEEATVADAYRKEIIRASDGGATTARTKLYDQLRGTTQWPAHYNGRGILNQSFHDSQSGMSIEDNKKLYEEAMKQGDAGWGVNGRITAYAGTGVGLVRSVMKAGDIVREIQQQATQRLQASATVR